MSWLPGGLWEVLEAPLELPGWSLGVHLSSPGCLKGSLEGPLGHSGGLVGVLGVLLVALGGVVSFLGRSGNGFREIPGDSGSHLGSILASFFDDFSCFFCFRFLIDFRVDFASIFVECLMIFCSIFLIFFVEFAKSRKCEN